MIKYSLSVSISKLWLKIETLRRVSIRVQWTWFVKSFLKFTALIKIKSDMTRMMKSSIVSIYRELSVNQFPEHMKAVILA